MAKRYIGSEDLASAVLDMLDEYHKDVADGVFREGKKAIKEMERLSIDDAPIGKRGEFRPHITSKSQRDRLDRMTHTWYVKAPEYRLTHLLVHGHKLPRGGKTEPNPFLEKAYDKARDQYLDGVEKVIRNGK